MEFQGQREENALVHAKPQHEEPEGGRIKCVQQQQLQADQHGAQGAFGAPLVSGQ